MMSERAALSKDDGNEDSEESGGTATGSSEDYFLKEHHCTDPVCCLAFSASIFFFLFVFAWGLLNGNMDKLSHGLDRQGQLCGVSAGVEHKPYVYYCPQSYDAYNWTLKVNDQDPICVDACPLGPNATEPETMNCTDPDAYTTVLVGNWWCLPEKGKFAKASIKLEKKLDSLQNQFNTDMFGIYNSWPIMIGVVLGATLLGYVYLLMLRFLAKGLLWICICTTMVALLGFGYYMWLQSGSVEAATAEESGKAAMLSKAIAIGLWVLAFLVGCLVCCCHGEVELSTACIQQGTEVIWEMPLLLFTPLVKAVVKAASIVVFFFGWVHLWSTAEVTGLGAERYFHFTADQRLYLGVYIIVAWWILNFVTALYQFSIAYAVAKYYNAPTNDDGERDTDCFGVLEGVHAGIRYHAGSLALGSALITALELAQKVLEYAEKKNKKDGNNKVAACILHTCLCCCKCLEGILQFISKNAYIDMAISSSNFCRAVRNVAHLVIDHGAAMAILNGATVIFQVVGMFAITVICGWVSNIVLTHTYFGDPDSPHYVSNPALATGAACVLGLVVSWAFMSVFDVATDTLLMCYAKDFDLNHGHATNSSERMKWLFQQAEERVKKEKRAAELKAQKDKSKYGG